MIEIPEGLKDPVDLDFLRNITDHDVDFERDLLKIFIESAQNDMKKMQESLDSPESNDWYLSSHSFKGSAASIGAFHLAKVLEYAQMHKDDTVDLKEKTLQEIRQKATQVIDFLTQEFAS